MPARFPPAQLRSRTGANQAKEQAMTIPRPVVLCIMDGWGLRADRDGERRGPGRYAHLRPADGRMPACAAGHASAPTWACRPGRWAIPRSATRISAPAAWWRWTWARSTWRSRTARSSSNSGHPGLRRQRGEGRGRPAHLMGVASDGGVHGHLDHIVAAAKMLTDAGLSVLVHAITDGRDVAPKSADAFIPELERQAARGRADRHGDRSLLRDGPRQPLGAGRHAPMRRSSTARAWSTPTARRGGAGGL